MTETNTNVVDQWRATCYHEAAHAVFALKVCDYGLRYVSAEECYCASVGPPFVGWAESWRKAMHARVGSLAERLDLWGELRPEPYEEVLLGHELELGEPEERRSDDYALVEALFDMAREGPEKPEEMYWTVVQDTEENLRNLWPEITAVADRLMSEGRLEGDEVARIIESVQEDRREKVDEK